MAYSSEQWKEAKSYFLQGLSLAQISAEVGINRTSISKKAKADEWDRIKIQQLKTDIVDFEKDKSTLDEKKSTLMRQISTLDEFEITILENIVENEAGLKSLLFSSATMALIRANEELTRGSYTALIKVKTYDGEGKPNGENVVKVDVPLGSSEIKSNIDAIDKASLTLGINQRHAKQGDVNVNATAISQSSTRSLNDFYTDVDATQSRT